jgi:tetratricopeptide (TPR) repeat protein
MKDQQSLDLENFDIVEVVPIPATGDRMIRLRTLEEAIDDFDEESVSYIVQMRRKVEAAPAPQTETKTDRRTDTAIGTDTVIDTAAGIGEIYATTGKLNLPYLTKTAEVLFRSGDYGLARNVYRTILQSGERTDLGKYGLARCYEAEGRLDEALFHYEESIAYRPHPTVFRSLATLLIRRGKNQEAAEVLERALQLKELSPDHRYEFHKTAGNCWNRVGNLRDAEKQYAKALELRPQSDEMLSNLGALYLHHSRNQDAEKYFSEAIATNPKNHQALTGLGSCALADGNQFAAHAWFARSLSVDLQNPTAIFHLVKCAYAIQNYAVAAQFLESYIQVAPVNVHLLYSLAGLHYHLGKKTEMVATCGRILELAPEHSGANGLLARPAQ